jgi:hypothetical protein
MKISEGNLTALERAIQIIEGTTICSTLKWLVQGGSLELKKRDVRDNRDVRDKTNAFYLSGISEIT